MCGPIDKDFSKHTFIVIAVTIEGCCGDSDFWSSSLGGFHSFLLLDKLDDEVSQGGGLFSDAVTAVVLFPDPHDDQS